MYKRHIKPILEKALKRSRVVLLNGARQVGKTTLATEILKENGYIHITFDDEISYLAAKSNITGFINKLEKPAIIDEVQRIPEIFMAIKKDVDLHRKPGRYLLTGSANPLLIPQLGDSLAGRMEVFELMPLSQGEISHTNDKFIDLIFSMNPLTTPENTLSKRELYERIVKGGFPDVQTLSASDRDVWMRSYLNLILQKDIKDLAQIEKLTEIPNLLKVLAARASNLLNVAEVARDCKLNQQTAHRYLALLQTIFMIYLQPSWSSNLTLRLTKSPKVNIVDSGLLAYLLNIDVETALANDTTEIGKLLENFVVGELKRQAGWNEMYTELYHFRTASGEEVDIVLENRAGKIVGLEVKNSSKVTPDDFKSLRYLKEKTKKKFIKGIVLYTGSQYVPFDEDLFALPINALWELS